MRAVVKGLVHSSLIKVIVRRLNMRRLLVGLEEVLVSLLDLSHSHLWSFIRVLLMMLLILILHFKDAVNKPATNIKRLLITPHNLCRLSSLVLLLTSKLVYVDKSWAWGNRN